MIPFILLIYITLSVDLIYGSSPRLYSHQSASRSFKSNKNAGYADKHRTTSNTPCTWKQYPSPCQSWDVSAIIMLQNNSLTAEKRLTDITSYLSSITSACDSESELHLFGPSSVGCNLTNLGVSTKVEFIEKITLEMVTLSNNTKAGNILESLILQVLNLSPVSSMASRTLFIFTDMPCSYLNGTDFANKTSNLTEHLILEKFNIRIAFLTDTGVGVNCYEEVFKECDQMDSSVCDVTMYGKGNGNLADCQNMMVTDNDAKNGSGMSELELVLIITIPAVCATILIIVVCIVCYKKFQIRASVISKLFTDPSTLEEHLSQSNKYFDPHSMTIRERNKISKDVDEWGVERENLVLMENSVLGNGAFAKVYKGLLSGNIPLVDINAQLTVVLDNRNEGVVEVAVKRLPPHSDSQSRTDFLQEIRFMKKLGYHAHVISMLGCVSNPFDPLILVEFCQNGDMLHFLRKHKEHILMSPEDDCPIDAELCLRIKDLVSFAWQISDGMSYLNSNGFVHRDLAARNVLITKNLVAKISDFGLCRYMDEALYTSKGGRLPIKWMALESLKQYEFSGKSDVWSFAIVLHEIFSLGDGPFPAIQPLDMISHLEEGHRMKQSSKCPNEIYKLMNKCWMEAPTDRPSFDEIRTELTEMLNMDDEHYGYLDLQDPNSKSIKSMLQREVSELPDDSPTSSKTSSIVSLETIVEENESQPQSCSPIRRRRSRTASETDIDDFYSTTSRLNSFRQQHMEKELKKRKDYPKLAKQATIDVLSSIQRSSMEQDSLEDCSSDNESVVTVVMPTLPLPGKDERTTSCTEYESTVEDPPAPQKSPLSFTNVTYTCDLYLDNNEVCSCSGIHCVDPK